MPMEYDQLIIKINASTLGLVGQLLDKNGVSGQITTLINDIVTDLNPYKEDSPCWHFRIFIQIPN